MKLSLPLRNLLLVLLIGLLTLLGTLFGLRFLVSGEEDTWLCLEGRWVQHGQPSSPQPTTPCPGSSN